MMTFIAFSFILVVFIILLARHSTRNFLSGTLKFADLTGKVTIIRDFYGVPHITADACDNDAFFALGFVHSQDRFWQMEFQRRVAQGRLSEILGKKALKIDKFFRTLGFHNITEDTWSALDNKNKAYLQAYTNGINAFLHSGKLPLQFHLLRYRPEPWTVTDVILWQKVMAYTLSNNIRLVLEDQHLINTFGLSRFIEIRQVKNTTEETTLSTHDLAIHKLVNSQEKIDEALKKQTNTESSAKFDSPMNNHKNKGTNAWVVSGTRTITGKPLLANDPHLDLTAPNTWYLAEITGPGLHVRGATTPGIPAVIIGHNDNIAWGISAPHIETARLYQLSNTAKTTTRKEAIHIRGGKVEEHVITMSSHGPVVNDLLELLSDKNHLPYVLNSPGMLQNDTSLHGIIGLNFATNWTEFRAALQYLKAPAISVVYADKSGNIGYQLAGNIFKSQRTHSTDRFIPTPIIKDDPIDYIPFAQLPYAFNPLEQLLVSANNKIVPDDYLYSLTPYWEVPSYRIKRIKQLLNKKDLTIENMIEIQLDDFSMVWEELKLYLLSTLPLDRISQDGLELLRDWNGKTTLNSIPTTIFNYWYRELKSIVSNYLKITDWFKEASFIKDQLEKNNAFYFKPYITCEDYLSNTLQSAMAALRKDLGKKTKNWGWGKIHIAEFKECGIGHAKYLGWLWNQSTSTPGMEETINLGDTDSSFKQICAPTYRQVVDLNDFSKNLYIIPCGQSDDPFSRYHRNLMALWKKGQYISMDLLPSSSNLTLTLLPTLQSNNDQK